jgi:hypothetical protein
VWLAYNNRRLNRKFEPIEAEGVRGILIYCADYRCSRVREFASSNWSKRQPLLACDPVSLLALPAFLAVCYRNLAPRGAALKDVSSLPPAIDVHTDIEVANGAQRWRGEHNRQLVNERYGQQYQGKQARHQIAPGK